MQSFEWPIEDIVAAHPDLYLEHCASMAVALMSRLSPLPCEFQVQCENFSPPVLEGDSSFLLRIVWSAQTALAAARVWLTEQSKPIVERGAVAVAALAFAHLIPDGHLRVTCEGERADYWLPRLRLALEVSGTESSRELLRRHRQKRAQMLANPRGYDGYVFVCCFAAEHTVVRWSYHTQEERTDASR